jgi:hypothetical protein
MVLVIRFLFAYSKSLGANNQVRGEVGPSGGRAVRSSREHVLIRQQFRREVEVSSSLS